MENAGSEEIPDEAERKDLGIPATRASIIEKLVLIGFIERKGDKKTKYLVPARKGEALIGIVPTSIQSASMTAEWERKLLEIEREQYQADQFLGEITEYIRSLIEENRNISDSKNMMQPMYEPVGICPCCGKSVIEKSKGFFCESNECKFALWKENHFFESMSKKITRSVAEQLLSKKKAKLKGCKSAKTGKTYDCFVTMEVNDSGYPQFGLEFDKKRHVER